MVQLCQEQDCVLFKPGMEAEALVPGLTLDLWRAAEDAGSSALHRCLVFSKSTLAFINGKIFIVLSAFLFFQQE